MALSTKERKKVVHRLIGSSAVIGTLCRIAETNRPNEGN
jgi:hypothetical protein